MNTNDLSYLREMAATGENAPQYGGRFYLFWGLWTALAMTAHGAITDGLLAGGDARAFPLLWVGYGVVGLIVSMMLSRSLATRPMAGSWGNRIDRAVWQGAALAILGYVIAIIAYQLVSTPILVLFDTNVPVAFLLYAVAFFVIARLGGSTMNVVLAVISVVGAAWLMTQLGTAQLYYQAAVLVVLVTALPGLLMMLRERGDEVVS